MDPGTILAVASIVIQGIDVALRGCRRLHEHRKSFQDLPDHLKECKARVMNLQQHIRAILDLKGSLNQSLRSTIKGIDEDFNKMKEILIKWENSDKCSKRDAMKFLKDAPQDAKRAKAISKSLDRRTLDLVLGMTTVNTVCKLEDLDSFLPVVRRPLNKTFRLPNRYQTLIGRQKELEELRTKILPGPDQVGLLNVYGIQGVGKTSLVSELAASKEVTDRFATVVWINATSIEAIDRQYCEVASAMAQPGARFKDILAHRVFVLNTLAQEARPALFVLDDFNNKITKEELALYLPTQNYVAVFLRQGWTSPYVISDAFDWILPALEPDAAMELLLRTAKRTVDHVDTTVYVRKIVDKLCCSPTSIVFAGQFILTSGMSLKNFLQHFHLYSLIVFDKEGSRDKMAATWVMSLLNFYPSDTSFTQDVQEMLIFCAILHSDVICGYFGRFISSKRSPWMERCCRHKRWNDRLFNELVLGLKDKALINIQDWSPEHLEFTLHQSIRNWLVFLRKTSEDLMRIILDVFQFVAVAIDGWTTSAEDLRHLQMYASSCLDILCGPSGIELDKEYSHELELHQQEILDFKIKFLAFLRKHPRTTLDANMLQADVLSIYEQCLNECRSLQADNKIILDINEEIAGIYMERTEYAMAEQIYRENLQLTGQKMSANLALCFSKQGKFTEAYEAFDEISATWDQLSTGDLIVNIMGQIFHAAEADDCSMAELLHDKLKDTTPTNDEQAQLKAEGLFKISDIFWWSKRLLDSIEVQQEALAVYEDLWGCEHYQWLTAAHKLCRCYFTIESWHDCEKLYCKVIRGYEKVYGAGSEHTNSARHCRSHALQALGNTDEAVAQHVLAFQNMLVEPGLQEQMVQNFFGCLPTHESLEDGGLSLYEETWAAARTNLSKGDEFRLKLLRELVEMYSTAQKWEEAEEILQILIADQESVMGIATDSNKNASLVDDPVITNGDTVSIAETAADLADTDSAKAVAARIQELKLNGNEPATEDNPDQEESTNKGETDGNESTEDVPDGADNDRNNNDEDDSATVHENGLYETYLHDLESLATHMRRRSAFQEAEAVYVRILEKKLRLGSCPDRSTLQTLLDLQYVCEKQERADAANNYQQRYIEASTREEEDWRAQYRRTFWI